MLPILINNYTTLEENLIIDLSITIHTESMIDTLQNQLLRASWTSYLLLYSILLSRIARLYATNIIKKNCESIHTYPSSFNTIFTPTGVTD